MLLAEYDYETDIAVQRAEEREIAFAEGMSKGISQEIERGIEQGAYQKMLSTFVYTKKVGKHSLTGLSISDVPTIAL